MTQLAAPFTHPTSSGHTVFAYVHAAQGRFADDSLGTGSLVLFDQGDQVVITV